MLDILQCEPQVELVGHFTVVLVALKVQTRTALVRTCAPHLRAALPPLQVRQHCMVAVLDPSRGFRTGDCQVAFRDLRPAPGPDLLRDS